MIPTILKTYNLLTPLLFWFNQRPRPSSIPTQSLNLRPFAINHLHDNPGSRRWPKAVGRGPGSGKGKFSARGMKGHKARSGGGVPVRFEGGQTPITRRLPKYNKLKIKKLCEFTNYINLATLEYYIKRGVLNNKEKITIKTLYDAKIVKNIKFGLKILAKGYEDFKTPINIEATDASKATIQKIEKVGGKIQLIYRNPKQLQQHLKPQKHLIPIPPVIPPDYILRRIQHIQKHRNVKINYTKPQWIIEQQKNNYIQQKPHFIYPVPRITNSQKIRKRKPKIFKTISYKL